VVTGDKAAGITEGRAAAIMGVETQVADSNTSIERRARMSSGRCQDDDVAEEIRNVLDNQYPFDAATGYKAEDLRGA
jgi:hypothetical protein